MLEYSHRIRNERRPDLWTGRPAARTDALRPPGSAGGSTSSGRLASTRNISARRLASTRNTGTGNAAAGLGAAAEPTTGTSARPSDLAGRRRGQRDRERRDRLRDRRELHTDQRGDQERRRRGGGRPLRRRDRSAWGCRATAQATAPPARRLG